MNFLRKQTLTVCVTNFDNRPLISRLSVGAGGIPGRGKFPCHISFCVYTFCRLLEFSQKLNMTFPDFHNIQSDYSITAELFKYCFKGLSFHGNQCKMQIYDGHVTQGLYTLFQNQLHSFTGYAQLFHSMLLQLSKIVSFWYAETKWQTCNQENLDYSRVAYCILRST